MNNKNQVVVRVTSIFALANDYAAARGPSPSDADYWRVIEAAKDALGSGRLAHLVRDHDGTVTLWSMDFGWSFRDPPASAYREAT